MRSLGSLPVLWRLILPVVGRKKLQKVFEGLYLFSLIGLNIGGGADSLVNGEEFVLDFVKRLCKGRPNIVIFDVGANDGGYSLLVKKIFKHKAEIHAFEPSRKTFKKLRLAMKHYKRVFLNCAALGEVDKKTVLYKNSNISALASLYKRQLDYMNLAMDQSEIITMKSLDEYCRQRNISHINFLKLDVEGHEIGVLNGAVDMLKRGAIDVIQFEFGGCNIDSRTYFHDFYELLKKDYNLFRILRNGLYPIIKYRPMLEAFYVTNYLAVRK